MPRGRPILTIHSSCTYLVYVMLDLPWRPPVKTNEVTSDSNLEAILWIRVEVDDEERPGTR